MTTPLLRVEGLRVVLDSGAPIVEDVSLELRAGEVLGLVGESGSGKTTTALALLGFARPGARIGAGTVEVGGEPLTGRGEAAVRALRGRLVSYVPQDPGLALNPALRVEALIGDMVKAHARTRDAVRSRARSPRCTCRPTAPLLGDIRTSSRAASSNASRSPPRSSASRGSSSSTSRRPGSTS